MKLGFLRISITATHDPVRGQIGNNIWTVE